MTLLKEFCTGFISLLKGLQITWRNLIRRSVTLQYPTETPTFAPRYRGLHGLTVNPETGKENCIGCMSCARICPDHIITMELEKREGHPGRYPVKFFIDLNACCFCGLCADVCPTPMKSLIMTSNYHTAAFDRSDFILDKEKLLRNGREEMERGRRYYVDLNARKKES